MLLKDGLLRDLLLQLRLEILHGLHVLAMAQLKRLKLPLLLVDLGLGLLLDLKFVNHDGGTELLILVHHLHSLKLHITLIKLAAEIVAGLTDSGAHLFVAQRVDIQLKAIDRSKFTDMEVHLILWYHLGFLILLLVVVVVAGTFGMRVHDLGYIMGSDERNDSVLVFMRYNFSFQGLVSVIIGLFGL